MKEKEPPMRAIPLCLLTVATLVFAVPAVAEDFYVSGPRIGVEIGRDRGYYRDRDWDRDHYRTYGYDRWRGERCRTTVIRHGDGTITRERRCRD
jgi:hypothetical protein